MLTNVQFQSIRALADVNVDLAPFTFFVGPNGCGKSTLLDQIDLVCQCSRGVPDAPGNTFGHAGPILNGSIRPYTLTSGRKPPLRWVATGGRGSLAIDCFDPGPQWYARTTLRADSGRDTVTLADHGPAGFDAFVAARLSWRTQRLALSPAAIMEPVDAGQDTMEPDGFGLAGFLAGLALNDQQAYAAVQDDLRRIVPAFRRVAIGRVNVEGGTKLELGLVMQGGTLPAAAVSSGTLLALALLAVAHRPDAAPILLIDDIDQGLHIAAQHTLVGAIRSVMAVRPELQVLCTTHSPYLLDAARPEEVRVMALDADGHSVVRPLTAYPGFEKEHAGLQTGEFWASAGESWIVGGRVG
jgi:energy-coupling factor transporter ATP-binding protein EcfA2